MNRQSLHFQKISFIVYNVLHVSAFPQSHHRVQAQKYENTTPVPDDGYKKADTRRRRQRFKARINVIPYGRTQFLLVLNNLNVQVCAVIQCAVLHPGVPTRLKKCTNSLRSKEEYPRPG